jgi:hypothetical protein
MNDCPLPQPLDDFLQQPASLPANSERKEALFQQTAQMLRQPRWKRSTLPLAVAAGIVFALLFSYFMFRGEILGPDAANNGQTERKSDPQSDRQKPLPAPEVQVQLPAQPRELEWSAFDTEDDKQRVRLYFQAGDLYLAAQSDIDSALRCYSQALSYCDARELEFDPTDNWLVMALKNDRRKEP